MSNLQNIDIKLSSKERMRIREELIVPNKKISTEKEPDPKPPTETIIPVLNRSRAVSREKSPIPSTSSSPSPSTLPLCVECQTENGVMQYNTRLVFGWYCKGCFDTVHREAIANMN